MTKKPKQEGTSGAMSSPRLDEPNSAWVSDPTEPHKIEPLQHRHYEPMPCLVVIAGRQMGQIFRLSTESARIGRASDAELCVRDSAISRYHARVWREQDGRVCIEDLDSTNGTFVRGMRVDHATLENGDMVQIGGKTVLKLEYFSDYEKEFYAQLYDAGTRDPLTGLFNRRYVDQHLEGDFRLAVRHGDLLSALLIDVDYFKQVNDTHGHPAGDLVLRTLAGIMSNRVRTEDIVGRYGGEEFVLILRKTSSEGARVLAEDLRARVADASICYEQQLIEVTISIGVATLTSKGEYTDAASLLDAADRALYAAKNAGRDCVMLASD